MAFPLGWIEEIPTSIIASKFVSSEIRYKLNMESFTWVCYAQYHWGHSKVVLSGALTCPTIGEARAIKNHFRKQGLNTEWDRRTGANPRTTLVVIKTLEGV